MQSKRDQVQAHSFVMTRLTAGMLLADPDAPDSPLGRTTRGVFIGVLITVLIAAGAVVFGLIKPGGNSSWRTQGSFVVDKNTGARYLYLGDRLRPVLNYASARLIGGGDLKAQTVSTASLGDTPIGTAIGIPGAPDSVPAPDHLDSGAWLVCSSVDTPRGSIGAAIARTTLVAGAPVESGALGTGQGLVVRGPDRTDYLVWQGSRLRLDEESGAAVSLGYGSVTPRPVSAAFLDALVAGPALTAPEVPGRGTPGPELNGGATRVGQVFRVRVPGSTRQYYLLRKEGLVPVTDTSANLLLGDPRTRAAAYGGEPPRAAGLGAGVLKQHLAPGAEGRSPVSDGLPTSPPRPVEMTDGHSACAGVEAGERGTKVATLLVSENALTPVAQPPSTLPEACRPVDAVVVRPGRGALVRVLGAGGTTMGGTTYLVGDSGAKYRVSSAEALGALGYAQEQVTALPSPLVSMLPTGPDLDQKAAIGMVPPSTTPATCVSNDLTVDH
ncbi:type VII secretion protein EccB [Streptomyces tendae]